MPVRIRPRLLLGFAIPVALMIGLFGYVGRLNVIAAPSIPNDIDLVSLDNLRSKYLVVVNHRCGGVLLNQAQVITSAHCVSLSRTKFGEQVLDPEEHEVFRVENDTDEVGVSAVQIHNGYLSDAPEGSVDVAILTLDRPIDGSQAVHGIRSLQPNDQLIYLARKSGPRNVDLGFCPIQLGKPYYDYGRDFFRCIDHAAQNQIGTCAGDSGSPIVALQEDGQVMLVAVQHAGHSLNEPLEASCDNGKKSLAYGVTLIIDPIEAWIVGGGVTGGRADDG